MRRNTRSLLEMGEFQFSNDLVVSFSIFEFLSLHSVVHFLIMVELFEVILI